MCVYSFIFIHIRVLGSGVGALARCLDNDKNLLKDLQSLAPPPKSSSSSKERSIIDTNQDDDSLRLASKIYSSITAYLITHPHLDHLSSLVINSSQKFGSFKHLIGFEKTLKGVELAFGGLLWPALASWANKGGLVERLQYFQVEPFSPFEIPSPYNQFTAVAYPVSHGTIGLIADAKTHAYLQVEKDPNQTYDSIAYFIELNEHQKSFLFWGDVEPDAISTLPRNKPVWIEAAKRFVLGNLKWIWIECSYTNSRPNNLLFGHFKPQLLIDELQTLGILVENFKQMNKDELINVNSSNFSLDDKYHEKFYENNNNNNNDYNNNEYNFYEKNYNDKSDFHPLSYQASKTLNEALFSGLNYNNKLGYNKHFYNVKHHKTYKPLDGLVIAITHVKEDPNKGVTVVSDTIMNELNSNKSTSELGVRFYKPKQGERVQF